jgi:hypothetical protein
MGCKDGANTAVTVIGTVKPIVNTQPVTTDSIGASMARANTAAHIAPAVAFVNATASTDIFDHAAKVGRERGMASPIPVSPAMETRTGRSAPST